MLKLELLSLKRHREDFENNICSTFFIKGLYDINECMLAVSSHTVLNTWHAIVHTIKADYVLFFVHVKGEGVFTLFPVSSNCSSPFFPFQFKSWMQPSSVSQEAKMVNTVCSGGVKVVSREQHLTCEVLLFVVTNLLAVFSLYL